MNTTRSNQYFRGLTRLEPKSSWVGALALLGTLLLFIGVSLAAAAVPPDNNWEEKVLPNIYKQLKQANKVLKSHQVIRAGENSRVIVTCANGEVRQYNQQGQLLEVKDSKGKVTTYVDGMPSVERDAAGGLIAKTEYRREGGKLATSVRHSAGEIEMKIFDNSSNIAQVNNSQGIKAYSNYHKNSEGQTTGYTEIDMMSGKMSRAELNAAGDVVSKVDENGNRTFMEYARDASGEVVSVTERDAQGNVTVKKMKDGQIRETIKNGVATLIENKVSGAGKVQESVETTPQKTEQGTLLEKVYKQFDQSGRLLLTRDREGEHHYSYVLGAGGRMISRREQLKPGKDSNEKPKDVTTYYDLAGRVTGTEEKGKQTNISYTLDPAGNILGSVEETVDHANGRAAKVRMDKKFDGKGHILRQTDNLGRSSWFEYNTKGDRTRATTEDVVTQYFYDGNSNLKATMATDSKSTTYATMNTQTKLTETKVRLYNSGFAEVTKFSDNQDGQRTSITKEPLDMKSTVYHDRQGEQPLHVVTTKFNGRQTITDYTYVADAMDASTESGPQGLTTTKYTFFGKPDTSVRVDQFGREYDTTYAYDAKQKSYSSLETDKKGKTLTLMNENEDADKVIRDNVIGFPRHSVEQKIYSRGILTYSETVDVKGKTISTFDPVTGLTMVTHTIKKHTFPRETFVYNHYDEGGDILSSFQRDSHGVTYNTMDKDGQMTYSLRRDAHGFPRVKESNYVYVKGEMTRSTTATDRDFSTSNYDKDALVSDTTRVRAFGFPRHEYTTYKYNEIGSMTSSDEDDINGKTHAEFNEDELTSVSTRDNLYGHAKHQVTSFSYDNDGYMAFSKEVDLKGLSTTQYDIDSLATYSMRYDQYGIIYARDTLTYNYYDNNGFMTSSTSRNIFGDSKREVDKDGLTRKTTSQDNFGLMGGRYKVTSNYTYDDKGRVQTSVEKDALGITNNKHDIHGDAVKTLRFGNYGVGMARVTTTDSTFDGDTGMTTSRVAVNAYGTTTSLDFDPKLGTEGKSVAMNNVGVTGGRVTTSILKLDPRHGLSRHTTASNFLGTTETSYDTERSEGRYGVAVASVATNNYGLGANRVTSTDIKSNTFHGLNERTSAKNNYGWVTTYFDTIQKAAWSDGTYGMATFSVAVNNYGIGATRNTGTTTLAADTQTGLNKETFARNTYGDTTTYYDAMPGYRPSWSPDGMYGMAAVSVAANHYGIGATRHTTTTTLEADTSTGLNQKTFAHNTYGDTTTYFDDMPGYRPSWSDGKYGMASVSVAVNNYGIGGTRNTKTTTVDADVQTGLNRQTLASNTYGDTTTYFDDTPGYAAGWSDGKYGMATVSVAANHYGIGGTRSTKTTTQDADVQTGLNRKTFAHNTYGDTTTYFDDTPGYQPSWSDGKYGMASVSVAVNCYGIGATRNTRTTTVDADVLTGLNKVTLAHNTYGDTTTYFDTVIKPSWSNGTYGMAVKSIAVNNYGIGATRKTTTDTQDADVQTGLNKKTFAHNTYGDTTTYFDTVQKASWSDGTYGMAVKSMAANNYGIGATRSTTTDTQDADVQTGLNKRTFARNTYGNTTTYFDTVQKASWSDGTYGMAVKSIATNNYGIGATRSTTTDTQDADPQTGLNKRTLAHNTYGDTTTYFDTVQNVSWSNGTYGMAVKSVAVNRYGIGATRNTTTDTQDADPQTGLNKRTFAHNTYGDTTTYFDTVQKASWSDGTYGMAVKSVAVNHYGIGATRNTTTDTQDADPQTGLNKRTFAHNTYGDTTTYFDTVAKASWSNGTYGMAVKSVAVNHYGIGATRNTTTDTQDADPQTGLNKRTFAHNTYGNTTTYFDTVQKAAWSDGTYGMAVRSEAVNNYGIGGTRNTTTTTQDADPQTGLNKRTFAHNTYGDTTTYFDTVQKAAWSDGTYGMAVKSVAVNRYGIGGTRNTTTDTQAADPQTGLNKRTFAHNTYGDTTTYFDTVQKASWSNGTYGMAVKSVAVNNYGIGATRNTTTTTQDADPQTGLNKRTFAHNTYGDTTTYFDTVLNASWSNGTYGMAVKSVAVNHYGIGATRNTTTDTQDADPQTGLNKRTLAHNTYGDTTTYFDTVLKASWSNGTYGMAVKSVAVNNYGIGATRNTTTDTQDADPQTGLNKRTFAHNTYGNTTTYFDTVLKASWSNGTYGMAVKSIAANNYGIGATRNTTTDTQDADPQTGLNKRTFAHNTYGDTTTYFDTVLKASWSNGTYGMAVKSVAANNYGIGATRNTTTDTQDADVQTGLNKRTFAHNTYGDTTTYFDTVLNASWSNGTYGMAVKSVAANHYGIGATRNTTTDTQDADPQTGLNKRTLAHNTYGDTTTYFDDTPGYQPAWSNGTYGMATVSVTANNYGIGATRSTKTTTQDADVQTGLNRRTFAQNTYGDTTTYFDTVVNCTWSNGTYGMAVKSVAANHYGIGATRNTTTTTQEADPQTGLNRRTFAQNTYGDTTTYFDTVESCSWSNGTYGMAVRSVAANHYGIGATRNTTTTTQDADPQTGLNKRTFAHNTYGDTTTYFDTVESCNWSNGTFGMAVKSVAKNHYGIGATRNTTTTTQDADVQTGLNRRTFAHNTYGDTTTYFDTVQKASWSNGTYGMAVKSVAVNHYGIGATRNTTTTTQDANVQTGLNRRTFARNTYGDTTTYFDDTPGYGQPWSDGTYGMATVSVAANHYGIGATRNTTTTTQDADPQTGLNKKTFARNTYGDTTTYFDTMPAYRQSWSNGTYGMACVSVSANHYGIGATRDTKTTTQSADPQTGLNKKTFAHNTYGDTTTYFDTLAGYRQSWSNGTYGMACVSVSVNHYGIGATRHTTTTTQDADVQTGLNKQTLAHNTYGDTTTYFDTLPAYRQGWSDGKYGMASVSVSANHYGIGNTRNTTTTTQDADVQTGLNKRTFAHNTYGDTTTYFDDTPGYSQPWSNGTYGMATVSVSANHYGIGATRSTTTTTQDADVQTGLNRRTFAHNTYGDTTTFFDDTPGYTPSWSDGTYGMACVSVSANHYGIGNTRNTTTTTLDADPATGLNKLTVAHNAYGDTTTYFDDMPGYTPSWSDGTYGMAAKSISANNYGIGATRNTTTDTLDADPATGLNKLTVAHNTYGDTTTYFDDMPGYTPSWSDGTFGMAAQSVSANHYGIGATRNTTTVTQDADVKTGLNRETVASNTYGTTTTFFDTVQKAAWSDGTYGMAVKSVSANNYGIGGTRNTTTDTLDADPSTGLNRQTFAHNNYGDTTTYYDDTPGYTPSWSDGTYGMAVKSVSANRYGLGATRSTTTDTLDADPQTGLNKQTQAHNNYGDTTTFYDDLPGYTPSWSDGTYGMAVQSISANHYGIGDTRNTTTDTLDADPQTGLNRQTHAHNTYGDTTTYFDDMPGYQPGWSDGKYGMAVKSVSENHFGIGGTRNTTTDTLDADVLTGLNRKTQASNTYGTTTTYFDTAEGSTWSNGTYGMAVRSYADNHYGLGATRQTNTVTQDADTQTGLNKQTLASNSYGDTTTYFDTVVHPAWSPEGSFGMAARSVSANHYGIGATRSTTTDTLDADTDTGLNRKTQAHNSYGTTTTFFDTLPDFKPSWSSDGTYGMAAKSVADNNYGLSNTRHTTTDTLDADTATGLNKVTQAGNTYGTTTTYFDTVEPTSWSPDGTYGMAVRSVADNYYGLGATRNTTTTTAKADTRTGLNKETYAHNTYGDTATYFDAQETDGVTWTNGTYGMAVRSVSGNHYGLGTTRTTTTLTQEADNQTGLNKQTFAQNQYGDTTTYFDTKEKAGWSIGTYGMAVRSVAANHYGIGGARNTTTITQDADGRIGLNRRTHASNAYGETATYFDTVEHPLWSRDGSYGMAARSVSTNNCGIGATRTTGTTTVDADTQTGLNKETYAHNTYGDTTTYFDTMPNYKPTWSDGTFGMAAYTHAENKYGITYARVTNTTTLSADRMTGLNKRTSASNTYGTTTTYFDTEERPGWSDGTYGMAARTWAVNNYGIGAARTTNTVTLDADTRLGLNKVTKANNNYGQTTTYFDGEEGASWSKDGSYGMAVRTVSSNYYGIGKTRNTTTTTLDADTNSGLNRITQAKNDYGVTTTYFDTIQSERPSWSTDGSLGMAVRTVTNSNFGTFYTRNTETKTTSGDVRTGLNKVTFARSKYGDTYSYFDTYETVSWSTQGAYGMVVRSESANHYGLAAARNTETKTTNADTYTGMNRVTDAENSYGHTTSYFDTLGGASWSSNGSYGMVAKSVSNNRYGIPAARQTTTTTTKADTETGLNKETVASNTYGDTTTYFDTEESAPWSADGSFGMAVRSVGANKYGIGHTRNTTTTTLDADTNTGLNRMTEAVNTYGTTDTFYDTMCSASWSDGSYGMAVRSEAHNHYGLGYTRENVTMTEDADPSTGLSRRTRAESFFGTTTTYFDNVDLPSWSTKGSYGVASRVISDNVFGTGATLHTTTTTLGITAAGMTTKSEAKNDYGTTDTYFKTDTYGQQDYTIANNNYGAKNERYVKTTFVMDQNTGLTKTSHAVSGKANPPTRVVDTEYDSNTGGTYGLALKTTTTSSTGATGGQSTVTTNDQYSTDTGMVVHSNATNSLMSTENYLYEPQTGVLLRSKSTNTYGMKATKNVQTAYDPNLTTGLNKHSYSLTGESGHYYSESWSDYDDTGTGSTTNTVLKMNSGISYGYAQYTYTTYNVDDNGITLGSTGENMNGTTYSYNTKGGLSDTSDYYGNYGVTYKTHTVFDQSTQLKSTGIASKTTAYAYAKDSKTSYNWWGGATGTTTHPLMSTTTTYNDSNGLATSIVTNNTYGASLGATSTTDNIAYDEWGFKTSSYTHGGLGSSTQEFDLKGTAYHTSADSYLGPNNARHSESYATETNDDNGLAVRSTTASAMNWSNTWYDDEGRQSVVQKHNTYFEQNGVNTDSIDSQTFTLSYSWTGSPSETREDTGMNELITQTWCFMDDNGFTKKTHTQNKYGLLGDEDYWTYMTPDTTTGMTAQSTCTKSTGDSTTSYFSAGEYRNHGCVSSTASYNKESNETTNTYYDRSGGSVNFDTGMATGSYANKANTDNVHDWSSTGYYFNAAGQAGQNNSSWNQKTGKDSWSYKWENTTHHYWSDNGLPSYDVVSGSDTNKTRYYDHDGYEAGEAAYNDTASNLTVYSQSFTQFDYGSQSAGDWDHSNPTSSTTTFGSLTDPFQTTVNSNFAVAKDANQENVYHPRHQEISWPHGVYVKHASVDYVLNAQLLPTSATYTDDKGTESWVLGGDYGFNSLGSRNRSNFGGSTMNWTYWDSATGGRGADITFTGYMGIHNGTGTETYTQKGVLATQTLVTADTFTEDLTFTNDGSFVTGATGTREDGTTVSYSYTVMGDITSSGDDKGITTWDPSTHLRTQTTGGFGTFTYTYAGDILQSIQGTSSKDGSMSYDAYWNMQTWTDKEGVAHGYTAVSKYKSYWTAATESFKDKFGTSWTGDVTYDQYGFYFKGETLKAYQAKVDQKGASNLVPIDQTQELSFLKSELVGKYTEKDTWTYHSSKDTRGTTSLGNLKSADLAAGNLKNIADVEITVNEDGSATATFTNIGFTAKHFVKTNRYRPVETGVQKVGDSMAPPPTSTYSATQADDPFYNGSCGYSIANVMVWQVAVYTTITVPVTTTVVEDGVEKTVTTNQVQTVLDHYDTHYSWDQHNYAKAGDGWMWTESGTENETANETMTQENAQVTSSPVGTKAEGVAQAAVSQVQAGTSVGVSLGAYDAPSTAVTTGTPGWGQLTQGNYNSDFTGDPNTEDVFKTATKLPPRPPIDSSGNITDPGATVHAVAVAPAPAAVADAKGAAAPAAVAGAKVAAAPAAPAPAATAAAVPPAAATPALAQGTATAPQANGLVSGAAVVAAAGAAPVPTPGKAAAGLDAKQALQAKLTGQFQGLGVQNAEAFAALALSKLTPQEIASALAGSNEGTEALMGALANAYQALLGGAYQNSILGSILNLVGAGATFDAVKQALVGSASAVTAAQAGQRERDARYARVSRDENGNIVEAVGKNGEISKFTYDASGMTETTTLRGTVTVKHFGSNNLLLSENQGGTSKTFAYTTDGQGKVSATVVTVHSAEGTQTLKYNAAGKLVTKEQNGVTQSYSYSGSKIEVTARNAQGVELVKKVYEGGRLVEKIDPNGHTQYSYLTDASGNVLGVTMKVTDRDGQTSFYKFNASGEMTGKAANGSNRFVKTEDNTAQEALAFESAKELFSDKRMVGEKLDAAQLQIQPVQVPRPQRH